MAFGEAFKDSSRHRFAECLTKFDKCVPRCLRHDRRMKRSAASEATQAHLRRAKIANAPDLCPIDA